MLRIISVQLASAYSMMLFMACERCVCLLWYRKFVVRDVTRWVYQKWSIIYLEQFTIKCFFGYINYIVIYFAKFQIECLLSVYCTMDNSIPIHPMSSLCTVHATRKHARTNVPNGVCCLLLHISSSSVSIVSLLCVRWIYCSGTAQTK